MYSFKTACDPEELATSKDLKIKLIRDTAKQVM